MSKNNIGEAILIVSLIYFYLLTYNIWFLIVNIFPIFTWDYSGFTKERKRLFELDIALKEAKIRYYNRLSK